MNRTCLLFFKVKRSSTYPFRVHVLRRTHPGVHTAYPRSLHFFTHTSSRNSRQVRDNLRVCVAFSGYPSFVSENHTYYEGFGFLGRRKTKGKPTHQPTNQGTHPPTCPRDLPAAPWLPRLGAAPRRYIQYMYIYIYIHIFMHTCEYNIYIYICIYIYIYVLWYTCI